MGNIDSELVENFVTDMSVQCDTPEGRVCQQPDDCKCVELVEGFVEYHEQPAQWHHPAVPRHVLQMFVYDMTGRVLIMHRSNTVRSARNVWSIPTGTHEIGENITQCITRELHEEFNLGARLVTILDQYENIAGDEAPPHYHWVLSVYGVLVDDVQAAVNKEPDRHDQMIFAHIDDLSQEFFDNHKFHESFHGIISTAIMSWKERLKPAY